MVKEALVVARDILFKEKYFEGFLPAEEYNYIPLITKNFSYHERGDVLEHNADLQQIIPYIWIVNPTKKEVFAYKRAGNENYTEVRLRNKWSCGLGGHIERQDNGDPIGKGMMRELQEEVKMNSYPTPRIVGYLNDDKGDVERVHFGVVALAETLGPVEKGDEEMAEGRFMSLSEIEQLFGDPENDIENWTKMSWPFVKKYLSKN